MRAAFEVTFLGHQGWLFRAGDSCLLVDPLLTPAMGHGGVVGEVYPPRQFDFAAWPAVDAVVLTHEHEDHFDLATLARLDRRIPLFLSARSSVAARAVLREMGFAVGLPAPGEVLTVGALEVSFFSPARQPVGDEWDVLPFLVRDRAGHGSFFSTVDVAPDAQLERALRQRLARPGIWSWANNGADKSFMHAGRVLSRRFDTLRLAEVVLEQYAALRENGQEPAALLLCGSGFCTTGERAWMNQQLFRADSSRVAAALAALMPERTFLAPLPGQTLRMVDGEVAGVAQELFLGTAPPPGEWPSRHYRGDVELMQRYAPFTRRRELAPEELEELTQALGELAAFLHGGPLFQSLYSFAADELAGRRPTFSLVLLTDDDGGAYLFEYDAQACAFVAARGEDPVADYVGGLECWAGDLLAVLRGEVGPTAIVFGRGRLWTAFPERFPLGFEALLWHFCHPLRRPERFLALYRRLWAAQADAPVLVRASGHGAPSLAPYAAMQNNDLEPRSDER